MTKALGAEGATITQLNMMRRHLSRVKGSIRYASGSLLLYLSFSQRGASLGNQISWSDLMYKSCNSVFSGGRFAQIALPAKVVSLILSDVLGDPLEAIASGPTVPCLTTAQCCLDVLATFKLDEKYPDIKVSPTSVILALFHNPCLGVNLYCAFVTFVFRFVNDRILWAILRNTSKKRRPLTQLLTALPVKAWVCDSGLSLRGIVFEMVHLVTTSKNVFSHLFIKGMPTKKKWESFLTFKMSSSEPIRW